MDAMKVKADDLLETCVKCNGLGKVPNTTNPITAAAGTPIPRQSYLNEKCTDCFGSGEVYSPLGYHLATVMNDAGKRLQPKP